MSVGLQQMRPKRRVDLLWQTAADSIVIHLPALRSAQVTSVQHRTRANTASAPVIVLHLQVGIVQCDALKLARDPSTAANVHHEVYSNWDHLWYWNGIRSLGLFRCVHARRGNPK
mgnify:CR=1 FL=1